MTSYGRGRLNGIHPPVGTVLGPNEYGELVVVDEIDERGCTLRLATAPDIDAMLVREAYSPVESALQLRMRAAP